MLTKSEAYAVLYRHDAPLREARWIGAGSNRRSHWVDGGACDQVDLIVEPRGTVETARGMLLLGAHLRLALGVAQAVSCCRGFEPALNQRFWQTIWQRWIGGSTTDNHIALSPMAFAHTGVQWRGCNSAKDAFWTGFLHGTPTFDATLTAVLDRLRPHLAMGSPPPLRVSVSRWQILTTTSRADFTSVSPFLTPLNPVISPRAFNQIIRTFLDSRTTTWSCCATLVGLAIDYGVDGSTATTQETIELLVRARTATPPHLKLTIDQLAIQLEPPVPAVPQGCAGSDAAQRQALVTQGRALGELLRVLLVDATNRSPRVHTVALLGCSHSDFRLVGAALSAVALASPPLGKLCCSGLFDVSQPRDKLMRIAWLTYALHCRSREGRLARSPPLGLSLHSFGLAMTEQETEYMQQLLARGTPLRDVIGEALRLRFDGDDDKVARLHVDCLRDGSTVRFARGTRLYFEPFRVTDEWVAIVLGPTDDDVAIDGVAHVDNGDGFVGVVYAGYGLVWAEAACVVAGHRVIEGDDDVAMDEDGGGRPGGLDLTLSTLSLSFERAAPSLLPDWSSAAHRISAMLPLLACTSLQELTLDRAVVTRDDLARLLQCFARLRSLVLDRCVVESMDPLCAAYTDATLQCARPTTLSLLATQDLCMRTHLTGLHMRGHERVANIRGGAPAWTAALIGALQRGVAGGVLRELYVDLRSLGSYRDTDNAARRLAHAVRTTALSTSLRRLHVVFEQYYWITCQEVLGSLRAIVVTSPLPPRARRATLAVLRMFGCEAREVAEVVLALAEDTSALSVTWSHDA